MPKIPRPEFPNAPLMRYLDTQYQELSDAHYREAPKPNCIPVGGAWMDYFFRMEAIRGCLGALRNKKSIEEALEEGYTVSTISVQFWNTKREYQTQRWEKTAHAYLYGLVKTFERGEK